MKRMLFIFILSLILRLFLTTVAYHGDLNNNITWGQLALERGFNGFYGSSDADDWPYSAPNQPPLYLILFTGTVYIAQHIERVLWWLNYRISAFPSTLVWFWEERGVMLTAKLPGITADLGIGVLIYQYVKRKFNEKKAIILSAVWLFNPVTWYSSAVWGQTDSVVNLFGLVAIISLINKKLINFALWFTLSLLFKPSLAIFTPIFFVIAVKQKYLSAQWLKAITLSVFVALFVSIWFHPQPDLLPWYINLFRERILPGEIGYLTANAFNFWWLVDSGKTLDSLKYFGLSARVWGLIITISGISVVLLWLNEKITEKRIWVSLTISSLISFLFMTRIHERYLYPYFPPATVLLGFVPATVPLYAAASLVHLFNLYHLFWAPSIPFLVNLYSIPLFIPLLSVITILILIINSLLTLKKA